MLAGSQEDQTHTEASLDPPSPRGLEVPSFQARIKASALDLIVALRSFISRSWCTPISLILVWMVIFAYGD